VATPSPLFPCPGCQGIDFNDEGGDNETLVTGIVDAKVPGFYVFSAPWEPTSKLLANLNTFTGYNLTLPSGYQNPNFIYAIAITPLGSASLVTYNSNVNPPTTYPVLPPPALTSAPCPPSGNGGQTYFSIAATGGVDGAVVPQNINTDETVYMIRHANAHPTAAFTDGDYVGAGQWRALDIPNALSAKLDPMPAQVYSIDVAQITKGSYDAAGNEYWSHLTPAMTAVPYAIANDLPYHLAASFLMTDTNGAQETSEFFFSGGAFTGQTLLMAWEHSDISPTIQALLDNYGSTQKVLAWPVNDYDTVWTVKLDGTGNLTVNNALCEGIDSKPLPKMPPQF
jgi:hypothetical protein